MSAADYRRMATECLELAELMSLRADRARLMDMASRWLKLAEDAERRETVAPIPSRPVHRRPKPHRLCRPPPRRNFCLARPLQPGHPSSRDDADFICLSRGGWSSAVHFPGGRTGVATADGSNRLGNVESDRSHREPMNGGLRRHDQRPCVYFCGNWQRHIGPSGGCSILSRRNFATVAG
jgi:hypothetical protein